MVFAIIIPIALHTAIKFGSSFLSNTDITRIGYTENWDEYQDICNKAYKQYSKIYKLII